MSLYPRNKAILTLSDGSVFHGRAIGSTGTASGELCYNTAMAGYQEILTSPENFGQLIMMTYPHIGNGGIVPRDDEYRKVMASGLITRAFGWEYSNPTADYGLQEYLAEHNVVGISGIDTRALVRHLHKTGSINAVISSKETNEKKLVEMANSLPSAVGLELASQVTRKEAQTLNGVNNYNVAVIDYGIKQSAITHLQKRGCTLRIFPAQTPSAVLKDWNADGYFLSSGPGDPNATAAYALDAVNFAKTTGKPVFGVSLGHQLMAISEGIKVNQMHVGHRGSNHPVKNLAKGTVEITTQNHGFEVIADGLDGTKAEISYTNLNDGSVEGLLYKKFNGFSVQFHPEASPGPHDSAYLFDTFIDKMKSAKGAAVK